MPRRPFFDPSSPWQYFILAAFAAILFLLNQVITVVPYPNRARDKFLFDLGYSGAALLFLALAVRPDYRRQLATHRRRSTYCTSCGYDLRMTPGKCPECGTPATEEEHSTRRP